MPTGVAPGDFLDASRAVNTGKLIMHTERPELIVSTGASTLKLDDSTRLYAIGQDKGADAIVAGASGLSSLRVWVLGGVTRDLMLSANRCSPVSH